jgi:hypothetical protein
MKRVIEIQQEAGNIYLERNAIYKDSYKDNHGKLMELLFPDVLMLSDKKDHNRYAALAPVICNLSRYCADFNNGGHRDSLIDSINYLAMLVEIDEIS